MDVRLIRRPHANPGVRVSRIYPSDPYLEWCWTPVAGPTTVALVRRVAELTLAASEARLPVQDLGRLLGLGTPDTPTHNDKLLRTMARAEQFGLAFTSVGVPGEHVTFGVYNHVALLPSRLLRKLPEVARDYHAATVERTNRLLTEAGLPALRSPTSDDDGSAPRVDVPSAPIRSQGAPMARRTAHVVPPTARLDVSATAPSAALDRSL
jgi:hypothetical protein